MILSPAQILKKIKKDYSLIAEDFDETRSTGWPEFEEFSKLLAPAKNKIKLLDIGCGNGRLIDFLNKKQLPVDYLGVDNNKSLLKIAKKKHPSQRFRYGDMLKIPCLPGAFDCAFCIAVLHHLPTKKLRIKALKQIKKILKPKGALFITVWNLRQKKYKKYIDPKTRYAFIPWSEQKLRRFYYAFTKQELLQLLKEAGFAKIKAIKSPYNFAFACYEKS